jgi:hypothetical protein
MSVDDDDAHGAAAPGGRRRELTVQTVEQDIGIGVAEPQTAQMQTVEKIRQPGQSNRISPARASKCSPRLACTSANTAALAQACGEHATGYMVGAIRRRRKPQNSSGSRRASQYEAASTTHYFANFTRVTSSAKVNPVEFPAHHPATLCEWPLSALGRRRWALQRTTPDRSDTRRSGTLVGTGQNAH